MPRGIYSSLAQGTKTPSAFAKIRPSPTVDLLLSQHSSPAAATNILQAFKTPFLASIVVGNSYIKDKIGCEHSLVKPSPSLSVMTSSGNAIASTSSTGPQTNNTTPHKDIYEDELKIQKAQIAQMEATPNELVRHVVRFENGDQRTSSQALEIIRPLDEFESEVALQRSGPVTEMPEDLVLNILSMTLSLDGLHHIDGGFDPDGFMYRRRCLRLVSRGWNSLIISNPGFWTVIDPLSPVRDIAMSRSFVREHGSRIRAIRVTTEQIAQSIPTCIFPELEVLELRPLAFDPSQVQWPSFRAEQFPRLRSLLVGACTLPPSSTPFQSAQSIQIELHEDPVVNVLSFLQSMTNLEEIVVRRRVEPSNRKGVIAAVIPQLNLTKLRRLELVRLAQPQLITFLFGVWRLRIDCVSIHINNGFWSLEETMKPCIGLLQLRTCGLKTLEALKSDNTVVCVLGDGRTLEIIVDKSLVARVAHCLWNYRKI
ncbi:hypothetical protein FRB90_007734 [Tulasnella sp. 427]|nr:hypothetical protein FRB90_007734 [Tulasnella sp. 427]